MFPSGSAVQPKWPLMNISGQCDATSPAAKQQKILSSKLSKHFLLATVGQKESERDKAVFVQPFVYPIIDLMLSERRQIAFRKETALFSFT